MPLIVAWTICFAASRPAPAAVHLWQIKEVFSNSDGSVQFIEMFNNFGGENFTQFNTLRAVSGGVTKDFEFPANVGGDTFQGHMLIATPGFGSLPGAVAPDFTFDQGGVTGSFFNPNASSISITFFASGDSFSFAGTALPKDGINSLTDTNLAGNLQVGINSPTNINDQAGSVNLSAPSPTGDYNGDNVVNAADYVVWRNTLTQTANPAGSGADGDKSGTIDAGDHTFWKARFGNTVPTAGASLDPLAVPEPVAPGLILAGLLLLSLSRRR